MISVTRELLLQVAPRFSGAKAVRQAEIVDAMVGVIDRELSAFEITSRLRVAHFLAQICHESAGFRTTEEFADGSAYEGRADLGNVRPGDGPRFKGRGLLQLTGRANYQTFGDALGIDLVADPQAAADPAISLRIAGLYWRQHRINPSCDADDLREITRKVNGGLNGLEHRAALLARAKAALDGLRAANLAANATHDARPVLHRGEEGEAVADLQSRLRALGFDLAIDGAFGAATELAVKRFQLRHALVSDGIVGPGTWDRLSA